MAIVIISSTSAALRKEVAENLAGKLGYPCLGREELVDQATEAGIPVGKLEMSVIKSPAQSEGLARLKEDIWLSSPPRYVNRLEKETWSITAGGGICSCRMSLMSFGFVWFPTGNTRSRAIC